MKKLLPIMIPATAFSAHASTFHGIVREIRIAAAASGGTRVSVLTSGVTDCRGKADNWYSFSYSTNGGPGTAWLAALLSSKVAGESIVIHGTSRCDSSGMERQAAIDLPSAPTAHAISRSPVTVAVVPARPRVQLSTAQGEPPRFGSSPQSVLSRAARCEPGSPAAGLHDWRGSGRVPGRYIVVFKSPAGLACIGAADLERLRVLPGVMPDSPAAVRRLAEALAGSIGATVTTVWTFKPSVMFAIRGATTAGVERLARDPRIASIDADTTLKRQ